MSKRTLYNYISALFFQKKIGVLENPDALNAFSTKEQIERINKYKASLEFQPSDLPKENLFETIEQQTQEALTSFAPEIAALDTHAGEKQRLTDIFKFYDETTQAVNTFKEGLQDVKKELEQKDKIPDFRGALSHLHELHSNLHTALKKQQDEELKQLDTLFKDQNFQAALAKTPEQRKELHDQMTEKLKETHKQNLTTFENQFTNALNKLHEDARVNQERINFFALLYQNNKKMRQLIDTLYKENKQKNQALVQISQEGKDLTAIFKGIGFDKINEFESLTGRKIQASPDGKSFSMELPSTVNFIYHLSAEQRIKKDMLSIAGAVRAAGHQSITMEITYKDAEKAEQMARAAYEACRLHGFEAKNITLKVNGAEKKVSDIFKDSYASSIDLVEKKAASHKKEREEKLSTQSTEFASQFKATIAANKAATTAAAAPPQPPVAPGQGGAPNAI